MPAKIISTGGDADPVEVDEGLTGGDSLAEAEVRACDVPAELHGWRVDKALATLIPEFSRSYLQQLLAEGEVQLRGSPLRKSAIKVSAGDRLEVVLRPTPQAMAFVAQPMALQVVYEDAHLLVIDKPVGLVVHPAAGHWSGTLLNGLLAHHAAAAQLPRAGIVHRLDKDTSGLMLVGKSRQAMEALVRAIAAREVQRSYVALGQGGWRGSDEVQVDQAVGRDPVNRLRMAVLRGDATGAKPARTTVLRLDDHDQATLVMCRLHTGRTHQIRVHMAWLGHPLVGDVLYGGRPQWGLSRQALHATRLCLAHPLTGEPLAFETPLPDDLAQAVQASGLHYNGLPPA
ncbi:RluA family pseudouridine synthase [Hydrogenophaga sp. NFH-34]|uniref:RluA family pseudouridine synthase n=1 Tax=Hydrogenophaga sp. NFH-34 TaxID=2744446 RepID=UPI002DD43F85|nr:RluA family pseudouridine synthase [Hydrogenophaga sp. NFH-34]